MTEIVVVASFHFIIASSASGFLKSFKIKSIAEVAKTPDAFSIGLRQIKQCRGQPGH